MVTATLFCLHSRLQHLEQHLAQAGAQETPAERTKWASQVALAVKNPTANAGDLWVGKTHWRRKWQPIPVFLDRGVWRATVHRVVYRPYCGLERRKSAIKLNL